ncbi:MAG: SDR family oxidoreductase [Deltaproteobacteria bacterium]|nr:SDR family oxidoreductase [Deltaproteobacteria bacterium]
MKHQPRASIPGLEGQTAIVTGASRGIGKATALELCRYGARVVLTSRDAARAAAVAESWVAEFGDVVLALGVDVSDRTAVGEMVERVLAWSGGRIDIVVNNAGHPIEAELWDTPLHAIPAAALTERFRRVADVDLGGARNLTHAVLPTMMAQRSGALVYVSSTPALAGHKATPYTEAKAGLLGLMRDVAKGYGAHGVRANAVAPGNIRTGWFDTLGPEEQRALAEEAPLGRWGEPEDVAGAILFLASPLSSFVTGQTLVVDGGKVIH